MVEEGVGMKIHVNRVPPEGLKEHAIYDPSAMDMDRPDIRLSEPFEAEIFATKVDQELVVDVDIRCSLRLTCARCLEEFPSALTADALFSYKVHPTDVVDITDDVRQEVILAYPMVPTCRPDCKGLCSACGRNLNVASCSHQATEGRSRDDRPRGGSIAI